MKYFINVTTLEELKKQYRRLAMIHHPDCGGSTEAMQEVNDEHDRIFEILKKQHNERAAADTTGKTRATTETPEEFRRIVDLLLHLESEISEKVPGMYARCILDLLRVCLENGEDEDGHYSFLDEFED